MTMRSAPAPTPPAAPEPVERTLRLATGLVLFGFVACHFVNHSFGIGSIAAMEGAAKVLLRPWQAVPGLAVLYAALLLHAALGLRALHRRRHFRIPASEAWQLALGLTIPLLLIPHAGAIRIGALAYDMETGYPRLVHTFFVASTDVALPRQMLLLAVVWVHGWIGLRAWLRPKPFYPRLVPALAALAVLLPALAVAGLTSAGLNLREQTAHDPAAAASYAAPAPGTAAATNATARARVLDGLTLLYLALLAGTLAARAGRNWHARRYPGARITYPGGRVVAVPRGFTVLEASRWAGIPHASVCGGRGRCSTCRVRVIEGMQALAPPGPVERRTLARIGAPAAVRLACQTRPTGAVTLEPLLRTAGPRDAGAARFAAVVAGGRELQIAALFVDVRGSTRLATGRLPYDVLFLFDRYIQVVTGAIRDHGGYVTSIAGDGVMSAFGTDGDAAGAARAAFKAALQLWDGLARLDDELSAEVGAPLRFGVGLHVGLAIVGQISEPAASLQFLGDTGNVAAKLEAHSKALDCTLVASAEALQLAAPEAADAFETVGLPIPGRAGPMPAVPFRVRASLAEAVAAMP